MACQSPSNLAQETSESFMQESSVAPEELRQTTRAALKLLLKGAPIPIQAVATQSSISLERTEFILNELGAERSKDGKLTGLGLSLKPTPHKYYVGQKRFFTWCAPDALLYPAILGHTANVASTDPVSGDRITLTVSPEGAEELSPSTTVVSWACNANGRDVRGSFCRYGRFFTDRQTAQQWQTDHPAIEILDVEKATKAIRQMESLL